MKHKVGDLVRAKEDIKRGIIGVGIILEIDGFDCYVLWGSKNPRPPQGWWKLKALEVINGDN